ncbi:hypothetical protein Aduo_018866 [Ancylostoma duodenale]
MRYPTFLPGAHPEAMDGAEEAMGHITWIYLIQAVTVLAAVEIDSGLRELSSRQQEVQQIVDLIKAKVERLEQSERSLRASVYKLLDRAPPPSEIPKALTYPYNLTKETVDDIYLMKRSPTAFARAVERELFVREADKNTTLDKRDAQDKVRWLRELIRYRYPSSTPTAEASLWSACQVAINDYHYKKRRRDVLCSKSS